MKSFLLRATAIAILVLAPAMPTAAAADDVVFPRGSRLGLAPPTGLHVSRSFVGFEDPQNQVAILFVELPGIAYGNFLDSMMKAGGEAPGVTGVKREVMLTQSGAGYLISADQQAEGAHFRKWILLTLPTNAYLRQFEVAYLITAQVPESAKQIYPESAIRAALASLSTRDVPSEEILGMLPFKLTDMGGFRGLRSITLGRAVLLTDDEEPVPQSVRHPNLMISIAMGAPADPADRERFAQQLLSGMQGFKDFKIVASEALRIGGSPGFEVRLEAREERTNTEIMLVQWLRFGTQGFMRIVGIAPKDQWPAAFTRFRAVRDGIENR